MRLFISTCLLTLCLYHVQGQRSIPQNYYLPQIEYNSEIPTPASWLGYQVGEWHASHDQLLGYMKTLAAASDRLELIEYGKSHENRALICLLISDPENLANKEEIIGQRLQLTDPQKSKKLALDKLPAVNYMGYSIHGNETSGSNAAFLVAYYLAAGQSDDIKELLKNTVILFDPCFNPDGMQRFSTWINSQKSIENSTDPNDSEYNEPWPKGRTNHYGFDLNRDWLVAQQPESKGRVSLFQTWKPNVLTDHHEMGSNATFFFQPGIPTRVNPFTPAQNQMLTSKIGEYHARMLSDHSILYYSGENYDDYYYGKGSTYPDVQGSIGILFEQASSRGTAQMTENGMLSFPYTIRNQVFTSLSTLQAVKAMRVELNTYLRQFYIDAWEEAKREEFTGYAIQGDPYLLNEFSKVLNRQGIENSSIESGQNIPGLDFETKGGLFIPCLQKQYRLVKSVFDRPTKFQDSIFYDISTWTLADAFGLNWGKGKGKVNTKAYNFQQENSWQNNHDLPVYAYAIDGNAYLFPGLVYKLLKSGLRVKLALQAFEIDHKQFDQGAILISSDRQTMPQHELKRKMEQIALEGFNVQALYSGSTQNGPDLGSNNFELLRVPKILLIGGEGVNVASYGEIWHLLDTRYGIDVTKVSMEQFGSLDIDRYNVLILPNGNYSQLNTQKLQSFAQKGSVIIALEGAVTWMGNSKFLPIKTRNSIGTNDDPRPYAKLTSDNGALAMPGAIFEAELDLSHPLCFGYRQNKLPIFLGDTIFLEKAKNPYATPVKLTEKPLISGYVHRKILPLASEASVVLVYGIGRGKVICFAGNPNFRAFWFGTNRLFANAILFGNLIQSRSTEK